MLRAAFFIFVIEHPRPDTIGYFSLGLPVDRHTRRGKNPAIVTTAGLRATFINGAFVIDEHGAMPGAMPLVAITHEHMPLRQAGGREQQRPGNPPDGLRSSGSICMNREERQHAVQVPQGTVAPPFPDRNDASVSRSHSEKSPAGTTVSPPEASSLTLFLSLIPYEKCPVQRADFNSPASHFLPRA